MNREAGVSRPKVFISYSWSSPLHQETVRGWAERLLQDGVEVLLDIFDLKEGHDKFSFMEKMVNDPSVSHVLVMCDKAYTEKSDKRKAGVGTESQIISREVYERVEQSKFIPVVCEFSEMGEPFLPAFLKSRIWIDFSSAESVNENWERLIRLLFGKPAYQKPALGQPPAYLAADLGTPPSPATGKFLAYKQAVLQSRKGLKVYRRAFLDACIKLADELRVRQRPQVELMGAKVLEDCGKLKVVRNQIIDWVLFESETDPTQEFNDALVETLEELYELKSRPPEVNSWNDAWFEAHSIFVYETFLYIIAALMKTESYETLNEIFTSHYLKPISERYAQDKFENFSCFYGYSESLQGVLAQPGKRLLAPAAELIKRQADREDVPFPAVIQAELLVLLMACLSESRWYPQTLLYSNSEFPFFIRAEQHRHFLKLAKITGISDADSLRTKVKEGLERLQVNQWYDFALSMQSFWHRMNMDRLDHIS